MTPNKPSNVTKDEERKAQKFDLQAAYVVLIQAYLRHHTTMPSTTRSHIKRD